jgi:hypothetical protein
MRLTVSYTVTETIDVEVKDYELTQDQIFDLAQSEAEKICLLDADNLDWEWVKEPKVLGSQRVPPTKFWFETDKGLAATNGHILIFKSFVFPDNFMPDSPWVTPNERVKSAANKLFTENVTGMISHPGWFTPVFRPLTQILGLKVLGSTPIAPGIMMADGELVGVVMPTTKNDESCFQFTQCNTSP